MISADALRNYANSLKSGYLKEWKAAAMAADLNTIVNISPYDYVESCLAMEGFTKDDCDKIAEWLQDKI